MGQIKSELKDTRRRDIVSGKHDFHLPAKKARRRLSKRKGWWSLHERLSEVFRDMVREGRMRKKIGHKKTNNRKEKKF